MIKMSDEEWEKFAKEHPEKVTQRVFQEVSSPDFDDGEPPRNFVMPPEFKDKIAIIEKKHKEKRKRGWV